jgi:hypothetical protein
VQEYTGKHGKAAAAARLDSTAQAIVQKCYRKAKNGVGRRGRVWGVRCRVLGLNFRLGFRFEVQGLGSSVAGFL